VDSWGWELVGVVVSGLGVGLDGILERGGDRCIQTGIPQRVVLCIAAASTFVLHSPVIFRPAEQSRGKTQWEKYYSVEAQSQLHSLSLVL
jgi:hypothetical protein